MTPTSVLNTNYWEITLIKASNHYLFPAPLVHVVPTVASVVEFTLRIQHAIRAAVRKILGIFLKLKNISLEEAGTNS